MPGKRVGMVIGAGPNVGRTIAVRFKEAGWEMVMASREIAAKTEEGLHEYQVDLSKQGSVDQLWKRVKNEVGTPVCVIYNAYSAHLPPDPSDPLNIPEDDIATDMQVNDISAWAAAQHLVNEPPAPDGLKTFIATGNVLPFIDPMPQYLSLGMGKSALAHMCAGGAAAYGATKARFYYASQVKDDGSLVPYPDGPAHADVMLDLHETKEQSNFDVRFLANGEVVGE